MADFFPVRNHQNRPRPFSPWSRDTSIAKNFWRSSNSSQMSVFVRSLTPLPIATVESELGVARFLVNYFWLGQIVTAPLPRLYSQGIAAKLSSQSGINSCTSLQVTDIPVKRKLDRKYSGLDSVSYSICTVQYALLSLCTVSHPYQVTITRAFPVSCFSSPDSYAAAQKNRPRPVIISQPWYHELMQPRPQRYQSRNIAYHSSESL